MLSEVAMVAAAAHAWNDAAASHDRWMDGWMDGVGWGQRESMLLVFSGTNRRTQ